MASILRSRAPTLQLKMKTKPQVQGNKGHEFGANRRVRRVIRFPQTGLHDDSENNGDVKKDSLGVTSLLKFPELSVSKI